MSHQSSSGMSFEFGYRFPPTAPGDQNHQLGPHTLDDAEVARFNGWVQRLAVNAPVLSSGQIVQAAQRMLGTPKADVVPRFMRSRIERYRQLLAMRDDPAWQLPKADAARIRLLQDYVEGTGSRMIPLDLPFYGGFDNALLMDLLARSMRAELRDYADFCAYRQSVATEQGLSPSEVDLDRSQWQTLSVEQALEARNHTLHYAPSRFPGHSHFRVT